MSTAVPEEHREVLDAPYGVLTTLVMTATSEHHGPCLAEDGLVKISLITTRQKVRNLWPGLGPRC